MLEVHCAHTSFKLIEYKNDRVECRLCGAFWNSWDAEPKVVIGYVEEKSQVKEVFGGMP